MRANEALAKIPIISSGSRARARGLDWKLRGTRIGVIVLAILIPVTGLFRIDVSAGFIVLGRQIWFSDFFLVFGLWLAVACMLVMMYSTLGTVFCGWACPQNTLSTWANSVTKKHLGKRAVIDWGDEQGAQVATGKNKASNWLFLGIKLLLASMFAALIPLLYFFPPGAVWSFMTFQEDARLAGSLHWIYTVFTFIFLVNFAVVRHFVCRYMCVYRMWQFLFKTKDTLHVSYDATRSDECAKCNFCVTTCSVDIDPRNTSTYDSCINCGECITVCDSLHEKKGERGLLRFEFGPRKRNGKTENTNLVSALQRLTFVAPVFLFAVGLFTWGLATYDPYHLTVYKDDTRNNKAIQGYQINVANKVYGPASFKVEIDGLAPEAYALSSQHVDFESVGRNDVHLHINEENLTAGLHAFSVRVQSNDGWEDSFRLVHLTN